MKRLLLMFVFLALGLMSYTQERLDVIDSSYVASTTNTISYDYDGYYQGSAYYDGIVGFTFTIANYVDTIDYVYLKGSYDGINLVLVDSTSTRTDGNYVLSDSPPSYLKYYLVAKNSTGDTASVKNIIYFAKKGIR